ncbi:MAG: GTP 3',8-cyclase MoaA [Phycisphaerales bacterium]|nr:MAG: GTP 3',8-cyclase MoaA [Phycisphaerales bacterium]
MTDSQGRTVRDLRLSVTDRCNYRCVYCMHAGLQYMPGRHLLSLNEYLRVARVCASLGIEKIRITGGEPTLYPQLDELIRELGRLPVKDIAMTTNGSRLEEGALVRWRDRGLKRLTLSLNSLRPERMTSITRSESSPQTVINAIGLARQLGYHPIKVNCVVRRGMNEDEIADFAHLAREHGIEVRLIEFMPLDSERRWSPEEVVPADEMIRLLRQHYELIPIEADDPHGKAVTFHFADDSPGRIGIIASVTRPFCGDCNRLRITADGRIRPCLFSDREWDLRPILRNGADDERLRRVIIDAAWAKPAGHEINSPSFTPPDRTMSAIGG